MHIKLFLTMPIQSALLLRYALKKAAKWKELLTSLLYFGFSNCPSEANVLKTLQRMSICDGGDQKLVIHLSLYLLYISQEIK